MKLQRYYENGWLIMFTGMLTTVACLGFGRFSLGAILPFMREGLGLNHEQIGWVASAVFFGYLSSTPITGHFVLRFTAKKVVLSFMSLIVLGMVVNALATGFWSAWLGCFLVGLGAGGAHVPSLGVVSTWFAPKKRGMALGFANSGSSYAIIFSGFAIPSIVHYFPEGGWRFSWIILCFLTSLIMLYVLFLFKNQPQDLGLQPIGSLPNYPSANGAHVSVEGPREEKVYFNKIIWCIGIIYFTWGFSYLVFSTFLVDFLMQDIGLTKQYAGSFFSVVGIASIISGFVWGKWSDKIGRALAMFFTYTLQAVFLIGFTLTASPVLIFLLIVLYSLTLWSVPTIMVAIVSDIIGPRKAPMAVGFITLFFGVGQFLSPIVTGYMVEGSSSYSSAFILSALVCLLGGMGNYALHRYLHRPAKQKQDIQATS